MIALLTGTLAAVVPEGIILDVHGVGYQVAVSRQTADRLPGLQQQVQLHIHTHVREDQLTLFGFFAREERALFLRLVSVSGIGPKLALTILSGLPIADLVQAVANEDSARLSTIPGIGKKTAERIIVELRDRLLKDHAHDLPIGGDDAAHNPTRTDALSALVNLGYPATAALHALRTTQATDETLPLGQLIKRALRILAQ